MGPPRRTPTEAHYLTQEEELEARRILLAGARKGDRKAKTELMESYGVKIYSEAERKRTTVVQPVLPSKQRRLSTPSPPAHRGRSGGQPRKAGKKSL